MSDLLTKALEGNKKSLGKLLTYLESFSEQSGEVLKELTKFGGKAHVIGITGIPGVGKSTLISKLIGKYTEKRKKVAVIAIDPSSPYSKGAFLGDRIRMQEYATNPYVFIRSVSTRLRGGLSLAALMMIEAFDAVGYDKIFVESVGVGQADIDLMYPVHTLVVVTMPGVGDEIQTLKAGIMEIGDIYVLNKSDKEGADRTFEYMMFSLEGSQKEDWKPKIIKSSAIMGQNIDEVVETIEKHYNYIKNKQIFNKKIEIRRKFLAKLYIQRIFDEKIEDLYEKGKIELSKNLYGQFEKIIKEMSTTLV